MTGSFATDMCDASGALLLDGGKRQWSPEIAAACGIAAEPAAARRSKALPCPASCRARWPRPGGCTPGTIVAAGAGDAAAGAIASRRRQRGRCLHLARHRHAVFRGARELPPGARAPDPQLLPWPARPLVPDGGAAQRRGRAGLGGGASGQERHRAAAGGDGAGLHRPLARAVPALSLGRADAAQQPACQGRAVRAHALHQRRNR